MLLAQDSAPGLGLWSLGLLALWSAALLAQSGEDRFGDRRIVRTHVGSIIPSTATAGTTPVDGTIIKPKIAVDGHSDGETIVECSHCPRHVSGRRRER